MTFFESFILCFVILVAYQISEKKVKGIEIQMNPGKYLSLGIIRYWPSWRGGLVIDWDAKGCGLDLRGAG